MIGQSRKNICFISSNHAPLDDRIYWKMALSLKKNEYHVTHLCVSDRNKEYTTEEGIKIIEIKRPRLVSNDYLDIILKILLFKNVYKTLLKKAIEQRSDFYHFHDVQINRIAMKLKALPWKPKILYDSREPYPLTYQLYFQGNIFKKILGHFYSKYIEKVEKSHSPFYDMTITNADGVTEYFKEVTSKVITIYNYSNFLVPESEENFEKKFDLIYCGGISKYRGAMIMLEVVKLSVENKNPLKLLLLGSVKEKGLKEKMEKYISDNKLQNWISMPGHVKHNDVPNYYKESKIGLILFAKQPVYKVILPIKLFEYMNFGLPIVGSNFGPVCEYIIRDKTGLPSDPENPLNIYNTIIYLLKNTKLYTDIQNNSKDIVRKKYNWKIMEDELLRIFNNL